MKKSIAILLVISIMLTLWIPSVAESTGKYIPGTYTGTAVGMGDVTVTITTDEDNITDVAVDTSNETPGVGLEKGDELAALILDAQGSEIDSIAGATVTSEAVKVATTAALAQAASGDAQDQAPMVPGTYTGTGFGSKSELVMEVEVDETQILSISCKSNGDTPVVSDKAIDKVTREIVEQQSLAVDALSGATLTSRGTISAVADALKQAGADMNALYASDKPAELPQGEDVTVDVAVVGGGASGIVAALAAKTDSQLGDTDSGLNVLVIENNGFAGGDMNFCGGYVASPFGTVLNEETGVSVDEEAFIAAYKEANPQIAEEMNENVFRAIFEYSPVVLNALMDRGLYVAREDARLNKVTRTDMDYTYAIVPDKVTGIRSGDHDGFLEPLGSPYLGESLQQIAEDAGLNIVYETHADALVMDGNAAVGVKVTGPDSTYTVYAKKIILCTGYMSTDKGSIEMFWPEYEGVVQANSNTNQATAQKWIKEMGGEVSKANSDIFFGYDTIYGFYYPVQTVIRAMNTVWVNTEGQRFMDESAVHDIPTVLEQPDHHAYIIFDAANTALTPFFDELAKQHLAWSADTLEELGEKAGIDGANLASTIAAYNTDAQNDGDTQFGAEKERMTPVAEAPFYAVRVNVVNLDTNITLYVNDDMQVLMSKDGPAYDNLYAAGGSAGNSIPNQSRGWHVMSALVSGAYAGDIVRDSLLNQ